MLEKFREITSKIFNLNVEIRKRKDRNIFKFRKSVTKLSSTLRNLDFEFGGEPVPPFWCRTLQLFGAYLAGIIDGDGNIRIIGQKTKYPQCVVKISSGEKQTTLSEIIKNFFNCSSRIIERDEINNLKGKLIHGKWYELEFYVSSKNYSFFDKYVIPYLTINYKKDKLQSFILNRWSGVVV